MTSADFAPRARSLFEHSASLSLGGGRFPCEDLQCRLRHTRELAQFAALYSDRVYIRNLLADYAVHQYHDDSPVPMAQSFAEDIAVIAELAPLIEAGRVVVVTPPGQRCPTCLWTREGQDSAANAEFQSPFRALVEEFARRLRITVTPGRGGGIEISAPDELLEHPLFYSFSALPEEIRRRADIVAQLKSGKSVPLDRETRLALGHHERLADHVMRNVIFEKIVADALGTSFLSERPIHLRILDGLNASSDAAKRNLIVETHLAALVPFATDVSARDLLTLRTREEDTFVLFRHQLNQAIDEVRARKDAFTAEDARQLHADVLAPSLAQVDQKVKAAKRDLIRNSLRPAIAWTGAISFGIYTGFLSTGLAALASTIGLASVLQQLTESTMKKSDTEEVARAEPLYFLWKVREKGKASR